MLVGPKNFNQVPPPADSHPKRNKSLMERLGWEKYGDVSRISRPGPAYLQWAAGASAK